MHYKIINNINDKSAPKVTLKYEDKTKKKKLEKVLRKRIRATFLINSFLYFAHIFL